MAYIREKPSLDDDYNQADQFGFSEQILSTLPCISINETADHHLIGGQAKLGSYWRATNPIFRRIVLKMFKSCRLEDFRREIEILTLDSHQHFVKVFGIVTTVDRSPGIVFEYFEKGNCKTYLAKNSNYSNELVAIWCRQLANAMSFLHDRSIIHQDIRPKNVFVTDNTFSVKLGGFSLARKAGPKEEMSFMYPQITEAFPYNAPEFLSRQYYSEVEYGFPADVYSLSITICELLSKRLVFPDVDTEKLKAKDFYYQLEYWKNKKRDFNPKEPYFELISICTQEDPASRPKMKELLVLLSDWLGSGKLAIEIERLCLKETSEQREKEDYNSPSVQPRPQLHHNASKQNDYKFIKEQDFFGKSSIAIQYLSSQEIIKMQFTSFLLCFIIYAFILKLVTIQKLPLAWYLCYTPAIIHIFYHPFKNYFSGEHVKDRRLGQSPIRLFTTALVVFTLSYVTLTMMNHSYKCLLFISSEENSSIGTKLLELLYFTGLAIYVNFYNHYPQRSFINMVMLLHLAVILIYTYLQTSMDADMCLKKIISDKESYLLSPETVYSCITKLLPLAIVITLSKLWTFGKEKQGISRLETIEKEKQGISRLETIEKEKQGISRLEIIEKEMQGISRLETIEKKKVFNIFGAIILLTMNYFPISILLLSQNYDDSYNTRVGLYIYLTSHAVIISLGLLVCCIYWYFEHVSDYEETNASLSHSLDRLLFFFKFLGICFHIIVGIAYSCYLIQNTDPIGPLFWNLMINMISLIQVIAQSIIILNKVVKTYGNLNIVIVLFGVNMAMFILDIFDAFNTGRFFNPIISDMEMDRTVSLFFRVLAMLEPFTIFYRYHSCAILFEKFCTFSSPPSLPMSSPAGETRSTIIEDESVDTSDNNWVKSKLE